MSKIRTDSLITSFTTISLSTLFVVMPTDAHSQTYECNGLPATIVGTEDDDVIVSLAGNDEIHGLWGNDTICAGSGNDTAHGDWGNDVIFSGPSKDTISGAWGRDTLYGRRGRDTLPGMRCDHTFAGGPGRGGKCTGHLDNDSLLPDHGCEKVDL